MIPSQLIVDQPNQDLPVFVTLIDLFFDRFGKILRGIFRRSKQPSFEASALIFSLLLLMIVFTADISRSPLGKVETSYLIREAYLYLLPFTIVLLLHKAYERINHFIIERLSPVIPMPTDQDDWKRFITLINTNKIFPLALGLAFAANYFNLPTSRFGIRELIIFTSFNIQMILIGICIYYMLLWLIIPLRVNGYEFKLFSNDPKSSHFIASFGGLLDGLLVMISSIGVIVVSASVIIYGDKVLAGFINPDTILFIWIPLASLFIVRHYSVGRMIRHSKQRRLNEVQKQITDIEGKGNIKDQETMDKISRLWDYHDRIRSSRDNALDLHSVLVFINSLLIPLAAFVLSNWDKLIKLFEES